MPFIEDIHEFTARMKCRPTWINNRWLFPNCAQSDGHEHLDPPEDPDARNLLRVEYLKAKLESTIAQYNTDRTAIGTQAEYHARGAGPAPEAGWREHLARLASKIERLQSQLAATVALLPESRASQRYDSYRNEQRATAKEVFAQLNELPSYSGSTE